MTSIEVRRSCFCFLLVLASAAASAAAGESADLAIVGGRVHDGGTGPSSVRDVVIRGDKIVAVGQDIAHRYDVARTIHAGGKVVAPGFIDPHTHPDTYIRSKVAAERRTLPWLMQGVTTIGIGVDGGGTPRVAEQRAWFEQHGVGVNLVSFVGLGPVRREVLGHAARRPEPAELARMEALVAQGMCEGAFGFSTGLFYAPQSFASTEEVIALARQAAARGGLYDTHQRDESSYGVGLLASTAEAIDIGRQAGMPVHFAHLKALGSDVHGQAPMLVEMIESARAGGMRVTADQYPWLASGTRLSAAVLPRWAQAGGRPALLRRLANPEQAARIEAGMRANLKRRGGPESILLTSAGATWSGHTLAQVAEQWHVDPVEAALRVIRADGLPEGRPSESIASFNMNEDDVRLLMKQPWVVTSSDGSDGHPRQYASFPQKYVRYVREQNVIDLDSFIHRSTGLTAEILGLKDRGRLRPGAQADVLVFDPKTYAAGADYLNPRVLARGVDTLLVNGQLAVDQRNATSVLGGRFLQHVPGAATCP